MGHLQMQTPPIKIRVVPKTYQGLYKPVAERMAPLAKMKTVAATINGSSLTPESSEPTERVN